MNILYIGPNNHGSTSSMRARVLNELTKADKFTIIDTYIPFTETQRIYRSIGFRYKIGPFIKNLNNYILYNIPKTTFDLIWLDKATFISPNTSDILRKITKKLVHYTPDTAFYQNSSSLFEKSLNYYDCFVTTKSFDLEKYPMNRTIFVPQGYDPSVHKPYFSFEEKFREVVFVGLNEPYRRNVVYALLKAGIKVTLAGKNWKTFKGIKHPLMEYLGEGLFGEAYARVISSSLFGLGLLSKRFPELHTTRTIEIPACGTALITEKNMETSTFFNVNEVIFYKDPQEISSKIQEYRKNILSLKTLSEKGRQKINIGKFSNQEILQKVLWQLGI